MPVSLVHRVIMRESRYNPRAVGRGGALGMMQIKLVTARGMGYYGRRAGPARRQHQSHLRGEISLPAPHRVAGGNHDRAVGYYAAGYYYAAKRQGLTRTVTVVTAEVTPATSPLQAFAFAAPEPTPRNARNRATRAVVPAPEALTNCP